MAQSKAFLLMNDVKTRMGAAKWAALIDKIRQSADPDDPEQLFVDDFVTILNNFKVKVSKEQLDYLIDSFPGMKEGNRPRIRVGRFFDIDVAIE